MGSLTTHTELLGRLADSDPLAWRDFVDRYGGLISGFARRRGLQDADAEDLVQDVLMAMVKVLPGFQYDRGRGSFRGYLKTACLNAIRRRQARGPAATVEVPSAVADDADAVVQEAWEAEWRKYHMGLAWQRLAGELSQADRSAFQLYAVEGQEAAATAQTLGVSVDRVYQAKSRILKRLSTLIAEQVADEG
ncbi:MAG: sigma-70 family RNA polymerase sigma factor [Planctomycetota bacterium]